MQGKILHLGCYNFFSLQNLNLNYMCILDCIQRKSGCYGASMFLQGKKEGKQSN